MADDMKRVSINGGNVSTISLYDANKQMYAQTPKSTDIVLNGAYASIGAWLSTWYKDKHFMLMCKELSYFTIIHMNNSNYEEAKNAIKGCLDAMGEVWDITYNHENDAYECWVKREDGDFVMFYLFDAQPLTIEVGGDE